MVEGAGLGAEGAGAVEAAVAFAAVDGLAEVGVGEEAGGFDVEGGAVAERAGGAAAALGDFAREKDVVGVAEAAAVASVENDADGAFDAEAANGVADGFAGDAGVVAEGDEGGVQAAEAVEAGAADEVVVDGLLGAVEAQSRDQAVGDFAPGLCGVEFAGHTHERPGAGARAAEVASGGEEREGSSFHP